MNKPLLKKISIVVLLGALLCLIESNFYDLANFTVFHHLVNGLICVLIVTIASKTGYGHLLGIDSKPKQWD